LRFRVYITFWTLAFALGEHVGGPYLYPITLGNFQLMILFSKMLKFSTKKILPMGKNKL
jgi:hypothetical protein